MTLSHTSNRRACRYLRVTLAAYQVVPELMWTREMMVVPWPVAMSETSRNSHNRLSAGEELGIDGDESVRRRFVDATLRSRGIAGYRLDRRTLRSIMRSLIVFTAIACAAVACLFGKKSNNDWGTVLMMCLFAGVAGALVVVAY